jgi:hypothetical protein
VASNRQRGAVAVMVAVAMIALVGFLGLVIDLGRLFVIKAELQNAADACALAAAQELDGNANALTRAENAGITVGTRNLHNFQSVPVSITPADISFATALSAGGNNSNYLTQAAGAPADSKYAMCTLQRAGIGMTASAIVGVGPKSVLARAVATLAPSQTNCALPIGMCVHGPAPNYGLAPGDWINTKFNTQPGGNYTGSFNWIDFTPPGGGANEIAGLLSGSGVCNTAPTSSLIGQTGNMGAQQVKAWNSRFGLYQNGAGNPQPATSPPDFTGYSYNPASWAAGRNALPNFLNQRVNNAAFQGGTNFPIPNNETALTSAQYAQAGTNRRLAIAPFVDCAAWAAAQTVPLLGYACVLMLHPVNQAGDDLYLEYVGPANDPNTPCTANGMPGGVGPLVPALVQ